MVWLCNGEQILRDGSGGPGDKVHGTGDIGRGVNGVLSAMLFHRDWWFVRQQGVLDSCAECTMMLC